MAKIGLWQIFQLSIFVLRREKYHAEYVIFGFSFHISVVFPLLAKFERHYL